MSLKHAVLAMLKIEPGTGYDLVKRFNSSIGHFWSSSHQQVYQTLSGLESDGLLECELVEQSRKPNRKVYSLTQAGHEELSSWAKKPAKTARFKDPLLIKLYAARPEDADALLEELEAHWHAHSETLADYRRSEVLFNSSPDQIKSRYQLPFLTLRLGLQVEEAWLKWYEEVQEQLATLKSKGLGVQG